MMKSVPPTVRNLSHIVVDAEVCAERRALFDHVISGPGCAPSIDYPGAPIRPLSPLSAIDAPHLKPIDSAGM